MIFCHQTHSLTIGVLRFIRTISYGLYSVRYFLDLNKETPDNLSYKTSQQGFSIVAVSHFMSFDE